MGVSPFVVLTPPPHPRVHWDSFLVFLVFFKGVLHGPFLVHRVYFALFQTSGVPDIGV